MSSVSSVSSASSTPQGHPATTTLPAVIAGRPAVVNLWATWCPPCRKEMPLLAQAQAREPGVAFIFVDQGENAEAVRRWLDAQASTLREVWLDPQMRLGAAVGSRGLPTTLFYSAEGQLVSSHVGPLGPVALEAQLRAIRPTVPAR